MNRPHLPKEKSNMFFCCVLLCVTTVSLVELYTGGKFGYFFRDDTVDTFMDLFESLILNKTFGGEPGIYPPVPDLVYKVMAHMVDFSFIDSSLGVMEQGRLLRAATPGAIFIICHILLFMLPFFVVLIVVIDGSLRKKLAFSFLISLSGIVLWSLERGNIVVYAFLFTFLFLYLNNQEDTLCQQLSYLCLALAASIKLYPAIFGIVLLEKKDWKGALTCFAEFCGLYVIAFFCCGYAFSNFGGNFINVLVWGEEKHISSHSYSLKNLVFVLEVVVRHIPFVHFAIDTGLATRLAQIACLSLCLWVCHDTSRYWEKLFSLSLLCIYIPSISYQYVLMFLLIPLVYFLNEKEVGPFDGLYDVAFALLVSLLVVPVQFPVKITLVIHQLCLLAMMLCICAETLMSKRRKLSDPCQQT